MGRYSIYFRMFYNDLWIISLWFTKVSFLINVCEERESKHIRRGLSLSNHFRLVTSGLVTSVVVPLSSLGVKEANLMLPAFCFWIHYKILFPIQIKLSESWYIPHISHTGCNTLVSNTRYKSAPSIRVLYVRSTYLDCALQYNYSRTTDILYLKATKHTNTDTLKSEPLFFYTLGSY